MSNKYFKGRALRRAILGAKVDKATATTPQGSVDPLFNIIGGRVLLTSLVGEVTTIIETATTNLKIQGNPTTGTTVDIAADLDCNAKEAGTLLGIASFAAAVVGTNAGAGVLPVKPIALEIGTVDLECGESTSGSIKWSATYIPLDPEGEMTPA